MEFFFLSTSCELWIFVVFVRDYEKEINDSTALAFSKVPR